MSYLIDTNVLARLIVLKDPLYPTARAAIDRLQEAAEILIIAAQNVIEFWAVATRPSNANGLGLSVSHVVAEVARFEKMFRVIQEPPGLFRQWRQLAESHAVKGKQVHDARLAAIMIEAGIDHILTFNAADFRRYPGITAVTPHNLTVPTSPEPSRTPG